MTIGYMSQVAIDKVKAGTYASGTVYGEAQDEKTVPVMVVPGVVEWQACHNKGRTWVRIDPPPGWSMERRVNYLKCQKRADGGPVYMIRALGVIPDEPAAQ